MWDVEGCYFFLVRFDHEHFIGHSVDQGPLARASFEKWHVVDTPLGRWQVKIVPRLGSTGLPSLRRCCTKEMRSTEALSEFQNNVQTPRKSLFRPRPMVLLECSQKPTWICGILCILREPYLVYPAEFIEDRHGIFAWNRIKPFISQKIITSTSVEHFRFAVCKFAEA